MTGSRSYLGMYDFPEITKSTNKWYQSVSQQSNDLGLLSPLSLSRDCSSLEDAGEQDSLFLGQTCGWPLVLNSKRLKVIGVPIYSAKGCYQHFYRSALVVSKDSSINDLRDLDQYSGAHPLKIAVNARNSCSGCLLLSSTLGSDILSNAVFHFTGAHEKSVTSVANGQTDLAAIDSVTFELLLKHRPHHVAGVKVIGYTLAAPALPYVTSIHASDTTVTILQESLLVTSASNGSHSSDLFLTGFHVDQPEALMSLYFSYIRSLQYLANSPSKYKLYSAEDPPEPLIDYSTESLTLKEPINLTSQDEDRLYLQSLQPSDAQYIDELLQQIELGAVTDAVDEGEYSVWKSYGEQHKPVRLIYPGGRGVVSDLLAKIRRGEVEAKGLNVVCFLGLRKLVHQCAHNDVDVVVDCWESDAHIVARLNPAVVIAYATGETVPGGDWGNVVLFQQGHSADSNLMLDSGATGNNGAALTPQQHGAHRHAIQEVSPWYYKEVRIHRAVVSFTDPNEKKIAFQRTLYSKFLNGVQEVVVESPSSGDNTSSKVARTAAKYSVSDGTRQSFVRTVRTVFTW